MPGFSPKLPMALDSADGFALTQNIHEVAKQNLRMLVLTNPGERVMIPDFGVGIRNYLFEPNNANIYSAIKERILQQTTRYLPYIQIEDLRVFPDTASAAYNQNFDSLSVIIKYSVSTLGIVDFLELNLSSVQL